MEKICNSCKKEVTSLWKCLCKKCYMIDYREKNKESLKLKTKQYKQLNSEKVKQWKKQWSISEKGMLYAKERSKQDRLDGKTKKAEKKYRELHRAEISQRVEQWRINNLDIKSASSAKRRCAKLNAIPIWYDDLDDLVLSEAHLLAKLRYETTGIKWHVDHIIPLQGKDVCGLHCWNNVQVIPAAINLSKGNYF